MKRRRHRHARAKQGDVELNLAAMLDMAFQLLTFFILTFRPAPVEGQLAVNLPPPVAQTKVEMPTDPNAEGDTPVDTDITLHMYVTANDQGDAQQVRVENNPISVGPLDPGKVQMINKRLATVFGVQTTPFDRIQIAVDGRLRYEELMKLVDVCTRQKKSDGSYMQKVSFVELPQGQGQ